MERVIDGKYHYNQEMCEWERTDKVQNYKGATIYSITSHYDECTRRHRFYEVVEEGRTWTFDINKRGGNIETVKWLIDKHIEERTIMDIKETIYATN